MNRFHPTGSRKVDPVCGTKIDPASAGISARFNGRTYVFCGNACRKAFSADPAKYAGERKKGKGFWKKYLERIERATGGKPPSCCR